MRSGYRQERDTYRGKTARKLQEAGPPQLSRNLGRNQPTAVFILGFQSPELWDNKLPLLKLRLWCSVMAAMAADTQAYGLDFPGSFNDKDLQMWTSQSARFSSCGQGSRAGRRGEDQSLLGTVWTGKVSGHSSSWPPSLKWGPNLPAPSSSSTWQMLCGPHILLHHDPWEPVQPRTPLGALNLKTAESPEGTWWEGRGS